MVKKKRYCYFNGKFLTFKKVKISPYDLGILRGYGVFDVMRTRNGKPFLLGDHWERLRNSAKELNLKVPANKRNFQEIITKLLKRNGFRESVIRTVLTGGISKNGFNFEGRETFYILIEKFQPLPRECFTKGISVITLEYLRDIPEAKITNYIAAVKKQKEKNKRRALEIIYTSKGKALEASTSNFFIIKNGKLITPKKNILFGITRKLVIKLAKENGFNVREKEIKTDELFSADEMFLTASNKDIVPVVKVDGKKIGNGKAGKITKDLMKIFQEFAENY